MDEDGGGELDYGEISAALKKLKSRVLKVEKAEAESRAEAAHWRGRANGIRAASKQVRSTENMVEELHNLKFNPSVEVRLASLLSKKQLKPADLLDKMGTTTLPSRIEPPPLSSSFPALLLTESGLIPPPPDNDKNGSVDKKEFVTGLQRLGMEATEEELQDLHKSLDLDSSGSLDGSLRQLNTRGAPCSRYI